MKVASIETVFYVELLQMRINTGMEAWPRGLRALAALAQHLSSIPSTYARQLTITCASSARESHVLF